MTIRYKAVCFDFDYTLADSSNGIVKCFRMVIDSHGWQGIDDEQIRRTIGMTLEDAFSLLSGIKDPEQLAALHKEYSFHANTYMNPNTRFYEGSQNVLQALKDAGCKIAIVSTKNKNRIDDFLHATQTDHLVDKVIGIYEVKSAKPDPEGLHMAIEALDVDKTEVLYVGDSVIDAQTAMNAGVDFCGVTTGVTTVSELAQYPHKAIISQIEELTTVVE